MKTLFDKTKLVYLHALCDIIANTKVRHLSYIERIYRDSALCFKENLLLLEDLGIVRNDSHTLSAVKEFSQPLSALDFKFLFLKVLFASNGSAFTSLMEFMENFYGDAGKITFTALEEQKVKFSSIRNLLMELEFITVSLDKCTYTINPKCLNLFLDRFNRKKLSPASIKNEQAANDLIGFKAELAVIDFELKRIDNSLSSKYEIEHTSQINVLAGYDIRSFESYLDFNGNPIIRYIEVKAVSIRDFKFFWSRNEIDVAKLLAEQYYLYLLPVITNDIFDLGKLMTICNPYKSIYLNGNGWRRREESISFSLEIVK